MKIVQHWLSACLIILINSSCAVAMGNRRSCDPVELPIKPLELICISDAHGIGQCYNPLTGKNEVKSMENYICKDVSNYNREQEWIDEVKRVCGK